MRKKSNDELGTLITREMIAMLKDETLSKDQRLDCLLSIMFDMDIHNTLLQSFANSLKVGFKKINDDRIKKTEIARAAKREYMRNRMQWNAVDGNGTPSRSMDGNGCALVRIPSKAKQYKAKNNIPLNPPSGVEGDLPSQITPEDIVSPAAAESVKAAALSLAEAIEKTEAFSHMRVNRGKLMKCLCSVLKKNAAAEEGGDVGSRILAALEQWTEVWKADDWRYVPGKVIDWIYDGKWLEAPRKKAGDVEVGSGCGECGVMIG